MPDLLLRHTGISTRGLGKGKAKRFQKGGISIWPTGGSRRFVIEQYPTTDRIGAFTKLLEKDNGGKRGCH